MRNSLFLRLAPVVAIAAFSATASAQEIGSAGVSIAGEGRGTSLVAGGDRAALFTSSAFVAPRGSFGVGVQLAGQRMSSDEGGVDASLTTSATIVSGYYGLTDRISLGAYLPYARVSFDLDGASESETGMADAGIFGRFQAYRSESGSTKFALGLEATLPTGDDNFGAEDPSYAVSGALSHRAGSWNLHLVPGISMVKDFDPGINFNVAAVRALSPRLSLSGEVLTQFGGAPSDTDIEGDQEIDLASGVRYRMTGNSAVDFGLSYNVASQLDPRPTTLGAYLGFNWAF